MTSRDGYSDVFAELIPEIKFPNLSISSRISTFFDQNWAENEEKWLKVLILSRVAFELCCNTRIFKRLVVCYRFETALKCYYVNNG